MTNENFFDSLNQDIDLAKTRKTLMFLGNRLKRFVNENISQPISKAYKNTILRGYKTSTKLIKRKMKDVI